MYENDGIIFGPLPEIRQSIIHYGFTNNRQIIFSRFTIISIQSQTVRFLENLIKQICSTNNSQFQHDIHKNSPHPSSKLKDHEFDVIIPTTYFSAQNKLSNLVGSLLLSRDANDDIAHLQNSQLYQSFIVCKETENGNTREKKELA